MKKLFISCPMKGRTEENIRASIEKMHKIAEIVIGEELEVIQSYIEDDPPIDACAAIFYLGRSLQMLSTADYFIGVSSFSFMWNGCGIESQVARDYGIPSYLIPIEYLGDDIIEMDRNCTSTCPAD